MADKFAAAVANWAKQTEEKQAAVLHGSLRRLSDEVAGNVPVVTGNLRNSRAVSSAPTTIDWTTKKFRNPADSINNAIAGVEVGQTAYLGFRAPYARKIEDKHAFMRLAVQRWRQIVDEAVSALKGGG